MQQHVDFGNHLSENGPQSKLPTKDRDRRKSQGESTNGFSIPSNKNVQIEDSSLLI